MLTYKGYHAKVEFDPDDGLLFGEVIDLSDTVIFEVENTSEVKSAFEIAVDDYLEFCSKVGKNPDKPFSGKFNVRLPSVLHRAAVVTADYCRESLNAFVEQAVQHELERRVIAGAPIDLSSINPEAAERAATERKPEHGGMELA